MTVGMDGSVTTRECLTRLRSVSNGCERKHASAIRAAVAVETREAQRAMTGADVVVETLEARGTKHVFGVSGVKIDKIYDRLLDSSIQTVVCRHEQNAALILLLAA
jgi:hypothetical protein